MTIAEKMVKHIELNEDELKDLVYGDYGDKLKQVDEERADDRRWFVEMTLIFYNYLDEKYYSIYYDRGLTECQENEFYPQVAQEVEQVSKFIEVKEWVPVAGD